MSVCSPAPFVRVLRLEDQEFTLTLFASDGSPRSEHEHAQRQGEDADTLTQSRCFKLSPLSLAASPPLPAWCARPLSRSRGAAHASPRAMAPLTSDAFEGTQAPKRKADTAQSAPKAKKHSTAADSPAKSSSRAAAASSSCKAKGAPTASSSSKSKGKKQAEITIELDSSEADSDVIIESPKKGKKIPASSKGKGASKSTKDEKDKKKKAGKGEGHAQHEVLIAIAALSGAARLTSRISSCAPHSLDQSRQPQQGCARLARAARLDLDAGRHDPRRRNQEGLPLQVQVDQATLVRRRL